MLISPSSHVRTGQTFVVHYVQRARKLGQGGVQLIRWEGGGWRRITQWQFPKQARCNWSTLPTAFPIASLSLSHTSSPALLLSHLLSTLTQPLNTSLETSMIFERRTGFLERMTVAPTGSHTALGFVSGSSGNRTPQRSNASSSKTIENQMMPLHTSPISRAGNCAGLLHAIGTKHRLRGDPTKLISYNPYLHSHHSHANGTIKQKGMRIRVLFNHRKTMFQGGILLFNFQILAGMCPRVFKSQTYTNGLFYLLQIKASVEWHSINRPTIVRANIFQRDSLKRHLDPSLVGVRRLQKFNQCITPWVAVPTASSHRKFPAEQTSCGCI